MSGTAVGWIGEDVATAAMFSASVILLSVDSFIPDWPETRKSELMEVDSSVGVSIQWRDIHYSLI